MTLHGTVHTPTPRPWGEMTPEMKASLFDAEWKRSSQAASLRPQPTPYELAAHLRKLAVIQARARKQTTGTILI